MPELTPEEAADARRKLEKNFQKMNIPKTAPPVDGHLHKTFAIIQEIKKGARKSEIVKAIVNMETKGSGPETLVAHTNSNQRGQGRKQPVNPNKIAPPPLDEAAPAPYSHEMLEVNSILNSNGLGTQGRTVAKRGNIQQQTVPNDAGASFVNEQRNKIPARMAEREQSGVGAVIQSGMIVLSEEDLNKRIDVRAKQIIEEVLNNYANKKKTIAENAHNIQLVKENLVKIDGKYFKLTPTNVVVKPKAQV